jgi:rubredoxin
MKVVIANNGERKLTLADEKAKLTVGVYLAMSPCEENLHFAPKDTPHFDDRCTIHPTAATVVADWASQSNRTPQEIGLADRFLKRWPEGPQLRTFWKCRNCGHNFFVRTSLDLVQMWDDGGDVSDEVVKPMNSEYSCAKCGHVYNEEGPFEDDDE